MDILLGENWCIVTPFGLVLLKQPFNLMEKGNRTNMYSGGIILLNILFLKNGSYNKWFIQNFLQGVSSFKIKKR